MGLFDNFSGSPLTAGNPLFSAIKMPDFNVSLDIGKSSGFGLGLFPLPTFGETKPPTQAEWAKQLFSNRLDLQSQDFHNSLQNIISPEKKEFDYTKWGMADYALKLSLMALPLLNKTKLQAGLTLSGSSDPGTLLLGNMQTDEAIAEMTQTPDWLSGNSTVNEKSFGEKFDDSFFGKNHKTINAGLDAVNSILASHTADKLYGSPHGGITYTGHLIWNIGESLASQIPGGQAVSMGMKAAETLSSALNVLLGRKLATEGKADAIINSNPITSILLGSVNSLAGENADTITKDEELQATVGSSYTASFGKIDDALEKSGKRYGLFSKGDLEDTNSSIREAKRQLSIMSDIADLATDRFAIRNSMSAINGNRKAFAMRGGYDLSAVRVGRNGLSINTISTAKRVVSAMKFQPKPVEQSQPEVVDSFHQGGVLELSLLDISEEYLEPISTIKEVSLDSILPEFREGGKVNVIPEGALHARLHHMENAENLTKKGIPVVSEKEGGELEQQAEIEREEIIFRLEVTKKLEELLKKYSDDESSLKDKDEAAIEAGKLLVDEILNNTIDNTNNLL